MNKFLFYFIIASFLEIVAAYHVEGTGTAVVGEHVNALTRYLDECKLFYTKALEHETNPFNLWISCGKSSDVISSFSEGDFVLKTASISEGIVWQHWNFSLSEC